MSKITILKKEIASNAALYSALDDQGVADSLNALLHPTAGSIADMLEYLLSNKNKSNTGTDINGTAILGRLRQVANSNVGDDPFGSAVLVDLKGKHAAQSFLDLLLNSQLINIDFSSANLPFGHCTQMEIWKQGDVNALRAISENKSTRGIIIGVGKVSVSEVTFARTGAYK